MQKLCVLAWRPIAKPPLFFRGDNRYEIYLPFISDELVAQGEVKGWVDEEIYARVFVVPILLDSRRSFAKGFIMDRFEIHPYNLSIFPTQIFRPIKRPERPFR